MKTKLFFIITFLSFTLVSAQTVGDTFAIGELTYKITALGTPNEVGVFSDGASTGAVVITSPVSDGVLNYDVTAILGGASSGAFRNNANITSVVLPSTVTLVEETGFAGCTLLASANLENLVQIDKRGFKDCTVLVPTNTTFTNLTTTGPSAFDGCDGFVTISVPSLTSMQNYTFFNCINLTSVTLSTSLTSIPQGTFQNAGITTLTIPSGVTSLGKDSFKNSAIESIDIPAGLTDIGVGAFLDSSSFTTLTGGSGITTLGVDAFRNSGLTSFTGASNLTSIGNTAFRLCSSLTSVEIPEGVTAIGNGTFRDCSLLPTITLPSGIISIGSTVFTGCTSLTSLTSLNTTPPTLGLTAFNGLDLSTIALSITGAATGYDTTATWQDFGSLAILNVSNIGDDLNISVYPNPVNDVVFIKGEDLDGANVSVYDFSGKVLLSSNITGKLSQINISSLATGVYFLKIETNTAESTKKIVKQ